MGTTADKLNKLLETKAAIKQAIIDKGVDVGEDVVFADYASKISAIESGGTDEFLAMRTLNGTDMSYLFYYYLGTELDVSNFDTSNTTNMGYMFGHCINLTELDLSNFNTINVTSMKYMFNDCINLEILDIRNFDMRNVSKSNMNYMFSFCSELHTLRLDNCDTDTINQIISSSNFPIDAIDGVIRKIYVNPNNIDGLEAPENWIFVDSDGNEIVPEVPVCEFCGEEGCDGSCRYCPECGELNENCTCEPEIYQVGYYKNKSEITEATTMVNSSHTDLSYMFYGCTNLTTINNIKQWDASNVTDMTSMFEGCSNLITLDLSSFNASNVTNMDRMFYNCSNLTTLDLSYIDIRNVTTFEDNIFDGCNNLTELILIGLSKSAIESIISQTFPNAPSDGGRIYINSDVVPQLVPPLCQMLVNKGWELIQA